MIKHKLGVSLLLTTGITLGALLFVSSPASAATITVETADDNTTSDSDCTFREAIINVNAQADTHAECAGVGAYGTDDTINFSITTGGATFTNQGETGYTIAPTSPLPSLIQTVEINGYTQTGSRPNTSPSPRPFNGRLLIEIDGRNTAPNTAGFILDDGSDGSEIRGLVINGFTGTSAAITRLTGEGVDLIVQGNYIGVEPDGLTDGPGTQGNGLYTGLRALVGGLDPEDRNVIAGNDNGGISPNNGDHDTVTQGNYIGVGADGMTPIPNSAPNNPGGMSIDNSNGHLVGGSQEGATNVISGNGSFAIFPDNVTNVRIQGNIIGPDWKGDPIVGNAQVGGIGLPPIGGAMDDVLIGGTGAGEGNIIAYNRGPGVVVLDAFFNSAPLFTSNNISILGNSIFENNESNLSLLSGSGLGIDLAEVDVGTITFESLGPTPNDPSDTDTGPNGYINFPVLNSATQDGTDLTLNLDLEAAGTTDPDGLYRVELFANDEADPSGYGEGQTYLGFANVANGDNQDVTITLAEGTDLTGKVLSATTTAMNNTTTSTYGSTSEFSLAADVEVIAPATEDTDSLANTGWNIMVLTLLAGGMMAASLYIVVTGRLRYYLGRY